MEKKYKIKMEKLKIKGPHGELSAVIVRPDEDGIYPLVIYSHGLGGGFNNSFAYSKELATRGISVLAFDFYGGSNNSKSSGDTKEMTVSSECRDLEEVIKRAKTLSFVDDKKIVLMGESLGGLVSALVSCELSSDIASIILCFPAFMLTDKARKLYKSKDDIPEITQLNGFDLSKDFQVEVFDKDPYESIASFKKPVLILHGDKDELVDISYSVKADKIYENSLLKVIENGRHGFVDKALDEAVQAILSFLKENLNL